MKMRTHSAALLMGLICGLSCSSSGDDSGGAAGAPLGSGGGAGADAGAKTGGGGTTAASGSSRAGGSSGASGTTSVGGGASGTTSVGGGAGGATSVDGGAGGTARAGGSSGASGTTRAGGSSGAGGGAGGTTSAGGSRNTGGSSGAVDGGVGGSSSVDGSTGAAGSATFTVDAAAGLTPISSAIYGVAFADDKSLSVATVHRWGGDCASTYNWQIDAFNCGADNKGNQVLKGFGYPPYNDKGIGADVSGLDYMLQKVFAKGIDVLLTVPTIGWIAKDTTSSADMTGSNPTGAEKTADVAFVQNWVKQIVATYGSAKSGGVKYYQLDNEPDNWHSMHEDVHPAKATAAELLSTFEQYGAAIKAEDPDAYVLFDSVMSPINLLYSPADNWGSGADEPGGAWQSHPLAAWYLAQLAQYEKDHGKRVVDCLDFHYPTAGSHPLEDTRSLWDPTYDEGSWITDPNSATFKGPIDLLPRMQTWIDDNYPGTGICISEYQYTKPEDTTAHVVEADALGLFGKYGVKVANFWTNLTDSSQQPLPVYNGFAMFRNYDGKGGTFGDISVGASSTQIDLPVYAATDSATAPTKLWVMLINKTTQARSALGLTVSNFTAGSAAQVYSTTAASGPTAQTDIAISNGTLSVSLPAMSVTLLVIPKG